MTDPSSSPRAGDAPDDGHGTGWRRAVRLVGRGLRLRCPNCSYRPIFSRWIRMRESCPRCDLLFDRGEPDYFIGGYLLNFIGAELVIVTGALVVVVFTWPTVPWTALRAGLIALVVPFPFLTYPFAKTVWLAIDLVFRPITLGDLAGHGENVR